MTQSHTPQLHLDILPPAQRQLWDELVQVPDEFTLYGGTAIALHLGHRTSVDFDFFGTKNFDPAELAASIPFLEDGETTQNQPNTLTMRVGKKEPVLVSFFGTPKIGKIEAPGICTDNKLKLASLIDLAGMKASVVQRRASWKDYVDIDALITSGIDLAHGLAAAKIIYGDIFNPQITLKALSHFDEDDLQELPNDLKARLQNAVLSVDLNNLPQLGKPFSRRDD